MADGTDTAHPGAQRRHFPEQAALAKSLEAAKLGDVESRVRDCSVVIHMDADLGEPLDPRNRVDQDATCSHCSISSLSRTWPRGRLLVGRARRGAAPAMPAR